MLFQSSLMFEYFTEVGTGFTHKHKTRLERVTRNKLSTLFGQFIC